jgi:predicted CopG family antitoxin
VKNITVTVTDDVYRRARRKAAEHNTSVSRLVADYLRLVGKEEELRAERTSRLEELFAIQDRKRQKKGVGRLKREEIYARNVR